MQVEFEQVANMLSNSRQMQMGPQQYLTGTLGPHSIVLIRCGIGKVNAACGATQLILHHHPDCVISTGVAGGIDKSLRVMDVVVSREVCHHDVWCGEGLDIGQVQGQPTLFAADTTLVQRALSLHTDVHVVSGLICTGDSFITERTELQQIKQNFPEGLAVDMESAAIGQVCHTFAIPFVSFRIISDTPGVEAHVEQYLDFWATMADKSFIVTKSFLSSL